jgi:hypothetical protein
VGKHRYGHEEKRIMKYTFEAPKKNIRHASYVLADLRRMTLLQLRDICERENIIHAALDRLDREELIDLISDFRGNREHLLIRDDDPDGLERLQREFLRVRFIEKPHRELRLPSKLSVFEGMDTGFFDDYRVSYIAEIDGVNAFVLDRDNDICAILRVLPYPGSDDLFLARLGELPCRDSSVPDYRVLLCPQKLSDEITRIYQGEAAKLPDEAHAYIVPLLDFDVCVPEEADMPLAIDFGTSNTAAGVHMSRAFYSKIESHIKPDLLLPDGVNYLSFLSPEGIVAPVLPTVIGVDRIEGDTVRYKFGFDAESMSARGYLGEGVCVFYDIKRWVIDPDEKETLTDGEGRRISAERRHIVKAYLDYVIKSAEQRFKCKFKKLFLSYPVKQRERFVSLYREIFKEYDILEDETFDEGIAVLYDIIGTFIDENRYAEGVRYNALILDCGGGTTDQSSASFDIRKGNVAYEIEIRTAYENGDTDFGGNNLTFRIMQLLKIEAARLIKGSGKSLSEIAAGFPFDQYRAVDDHGRELVYKELEEAYLAAESVIPTRYRDHEYDGRETYYMVHNNFHCLFDLAERVKKAFFANDRILRIVVSSEESVHREDTVRIAAPKWKLSARTGGALTVQKNFPAIDINTHQVRAVFLADIYDIFRRFVGRLYEDGGLSAYSVVKLTGQSCKIGLFRDSLKEYIPGLLIRQGPSAKTDRYGLKLACLAGAIRYLRDKRLGLARVNIQSERPALPYVLSAFTHDGKKITLIRPLDREHVSGSVSRNVAAGEIELTLSDAKGRERYVYNIVADRDAFRKVTYEEIEEKYGERIPQAETDTVENGEVRYFVWADAGQWGFSLVPVSRQNEDLYLGAEQLRSFESEGWMVNWFDGRH